MSFRAIIIIPSTKAPPGSDIEFHNRKLPIVAETIDNIRLQALCHMGSGRGIQP